MLTKFLEKFFPDSKITEFWKTPRKRALVLLPIWIIFIALVFVLYVIPYNNKMKKYKGYEENLANENLVSDNTTLDVNTEDLNNLWNDLINMDYEYKIVLYKGENIIQYEGIKADGSVSGTKSDNESSYEYFIEDDIVYNVDGENATEYDTLLNIEYDIYLNPKYIYRKISEITPSKNESGYIYENGSDCVIISVGEYINSIEVDLENTKYILNFTRID